MFGRCGGGGRRVAARHSAPLIAVLTTVTRSNSVELVDVSQGGARIMAGLLPPSGDEVMVTIDTVRAYGTIVWSRRGECGLQFDPPLSDDDIDQLDALAAPARKMPLGLKTAMDHWTEGFAR